MFGLSASVRSAHFLGSSRSSDLAGSVREASDRSSAAASSSSHSCASRTSIAHSLVRSLLSLYRRLGCSSGFCCGCQVPSAINTVAGSSKRPYCDVSVLQYCPLASGKSFGEDDSS